MVNYCRGSSEYSIFSTFVVILICRLHTKYAYIVTLYDKRTPEGTMLCESCLTHDVRVICIFSKTHFFGRFFSLFLIFKVKFMLVLTREFPLRKKHTNPLKRVFFRKRKNRSKRENKQTNKMNKKGQKVGVQRRNALL